MPVVPKPKSQETTPVPAADSAAAAVGLSEAEAAYRKLEPRLAAIPRDALAPLNVDLQVASVFVLGVARFVTEPSLRARFAKLAKTGEYDAACVEDLGPAAQAAWYARHRLLLANALRSDARLSAALVDEAVALRSRLLKLADYWLGDDIALAAEITAIRAGTGHQDLANDLIALAALLKRNKSEVSQDKKLYRATDIATANRLGGAILEELGAAATAEQSEWAAAQPRVWTHLANTYAEVQRGGLFLFANDRGDERFPSLIAVGRSAMSRGTRKGENGTSPEGEDTTPAVGEGTPEISAGKQGSGPSAPKG